MKGKRFIFLPGALACCALSVLFVKAAVNTTQKRVAYIITWKAEAHFDDGRVVKVYTETRYVASTRVIEPVSIKHGEPSSAQMAHANNPRLASPYRNNPQQAGNTQPQNDRPYVRKSLRQVAAERDIEVPLPTDTTVEFETLDGLKANSVVAVYGRIVKETSGFTESGDLITTDYTFNVKRVIKDNRLKYASLTGESEVLPLDTSLKFYRAGGDVIVNGYRASQKLEGGELLSQGKDYILFLCWNPYAKSYFLAGISGAFLVDKHNLIKPLSNDAGLKKYEGTDLEALIDELLNGK